MMLSALIQLKVRKSMNVSCTCKFVRVMATFAREPEADTSDMFGHVDPGFEDGDFGITRFGIPCVRANRRGGMPMKGSILAGAAQTSAVDLFRYQPCSGCLRSESQFCGPGCCVVVEWLAYGMFPIYVCPSFRIVIPGDGNGELDSAAPYAVDLL